MPKFQNEKKKEKSKKSVHIFHNSVPFCLPIIKIIYFLQKKILSAHNNFIVQENIIFRSMNSNWMTKGARNRDRSFSNNYAWAIHVSSVEPAYNDTMKFWPSKGQLISKCPFGVIVLTKLPTKKFDKICPTHSRAEFVKFFRWYFGRNDENKWTFWN